MGLVALARTQYVRSGDVDIAFQVLGEGLRDIVLAFDWASHLETIAEQPLFVELVGSLARFARVIWLDMRGGGMSGRVPGGAISAEAWMDDLVAVMDAAGSGKASLVAHGHAAQMAMVAAATHPERVSSLVLINGFARLARAEDYPAGLPVEVQAALLEDVEGEWGTGKHVHVLGPSVAGRPGVEEWWGRVERYGATPGLARAKMQSILELDFRNVLPLIDVPTLVVHSRDNAFIRIDHGRYLAEHIPRARLLERASADHWALPDPDLLGAIEEFVTGTRSEATGGDRVLATVLFVDVVGSTERVSELGDQRWQLVLDRFEQAARGELRAHDGRLDHTTGDGLVATFDGPARAIRCAWAIRDEARRVGVEVRSGLHAGEITRRSDGIFGLAVHIGARVCDLAASGEVLVTRTVRDLVAGSGIAFEERGEHELKGVPDRWAVYAAAG